MLKLIKSLYRKLVPRNIRSLLVVHQFKTHLLKHEWIYDSEYYEKSVDGAAILSSSVMVRSIFQEFAPKCVVDVGCGTGALILAFRDHGCETFGLEYSPAGIAMCQKRGLNVKRFDLENEKLDDMTKYDVVTSMEVAEHLPEKSADTFVDLLCGLGDCIVFSAAHPGQGGSDHVNEQPQNYWIQKFEERGFSHQRNLSDSWKIQWQESGKVANWYYENIMVFKRAS